MKNLNQNQRKDALREAQILKKVRHPNIIKYYKSFISNEMLYIVMEYA